MRAGSRILVLVSVLALTGQSASAELNDYQQASARVAARAKAGPATAHRARNVILFVGDGMGISTITASRILEGQRKGQSGEENQLSFEEFLGLGAGQIQIPF